MSRSRSCVSQVNPSPATTRRTSGKRSASTRFSPVSQSPFTNCTTPAGIPHPTQRITMPKAEEDFPLPLPVWTMIRPRSSVLAAIMRSRAARIFSILALWRSASSIGSLA